MAGTALVALFALPGTAFADFNVLGSWTATTSLGQTCTMQALGGSNSHPSWHGVPVTLLSEIDFGIVLDCPAGTLQTSNDLVSMRAANPNDPTAPNDYIQYIYNPNAYSDAGCNVGYHGGPYWPDYCYQTGRYDGGSPNHQYQIGGGVYPSSGFDLDTLNYQASWSSYPSNCFIPTKSAPWYLRCAIPIFVVTGYSGP
jgi:hypothetical protein